MMKKNKWTKEEAYLFQKCIIALCYLSTGGQRREMIAFMTLTVKFYFLILQNWFYNVIRNKWLYVAPFEKKVRKGREGLPLPEYLAKILVFWRDKIREYMKPKNCNSLWVNWYGRPAGIVIISHKLEKKTITDYVATAICEFMPDKKWLPSDIRRNIVTTVYDLQIHDKNKSFFEFWEDLALLLNTSTKICLNLLIFRY